MITPSYEPTENEMQLLREWQKSNLEMNRIDLDRCAFWSTDYTTVWWQAEYGRDEIQLHEYRHSHYGTIRAAAYSRENIIFIQCIS